MYLKVCLPSTAMLCSEWWAFEVVIFMGGIIGVMDLASLTICLNIHALLFRVPLGFTEASGALLGNSIGANNVPLAYRFFALILKLAIATMFLISTMVVLGRAILIHLFTDDEALSNVTDKALIVLGCVFFSDGLQGIMHGPLRSMGLQTYGSIVAFVCWWLYGLPCAAFLAFYADLGLPGLMGGFYSATII